MLDHASPALLMAPLAALWLARALLARSTQPGGRMLPVLALAFCGALAWAGSQQWLRAYPVLVSAMGLVIFAGSLWRGRPVIERIARVRHPDLPPQGVRYTRRVTQVWCVFFLCNGSIAAALGLWAPWSWWTLYNGIISYLLIGLLIAGEWLVRPAMGRAP
ncbi:hypothetical protein [Azonexus sp.]|uniref:COG4648 family protein n=1 Tax=Azonexus sp. TaxID=1872668 RepID=UPI002837E898|nr:hypothetical protein [Azonexus sp.]MDR1994336.1 hypothetical protein [Azonexus sp.]